MKLRALGLALLLSLFSGVFAAAAGAEQASQPNVAAAATLDAGEYHTCAVLNDRSVRCWGFSGDGQLGYGNTTTIGDDETPASAGPVDLGAGRTAAAISTGYFHTCAVLDDGAVRCWGFGVDGRLGYGNPHSIGDDETPGSVGPVDLGRGHTATAISAGSGHTCAILDDGSVRCWGFGGSVFGGTGALGYGTTDTIGDDETPAAAGPVNLGTDRTAKAITAGGVHTCALLDNGTVRCWGRGREGQLGYGNTNTIGDDETPNTAGPVNLGPGRTATAITAGDAHTCALLDDGTVRCWGLGSSGQLGYGNTNNVGDTPATTPDKTGPVDLGPGRTAIAISAGGQHTCAVLDDRSVRCWGLGSNGQLGYGNTNNVGDTPAATPDKTGPVDLGPGRSAIAISAGIRHTCARLDDGRVRCWGDGVGGRLGYCNETTIGDDETPGSVGPVHIEANDGGVGCPTSVGAPMAMSPSGTQAGVSQTVPHGFSAASRARALRRCLNAATARRKRDEQLVRRRSRRQRAAYRDRFNHRANMRRQRCLHRYARTPGSVTRLSARTAGHTQIELAFDATGTDGNHQPPAHSYLIKQSLRPIRTARDFARAQTLCAGACRFTPYRVGAKISLTVTKLSAHTTYYYAVAARDNVSGHRGPRSPAVTAKTD